MPEALPARSLVCRLFLVSVVWSAHQLGALMPLAAGETITYDNGQSGQISLAVYNARDQLVRELLRTEPQTLGRHEIHWDGLDQTGQPVAPGQYRWKLLRTPGLTTHYQMMLGTNATPDHAAWPGDHAGPSAVLVDGDEMYVGARAGETFPVLVKQSLDGSQRYWQHRAKGVLRLQIDQGKLYVLQVTGEVKILDAKTGAELDAVTLAAPRIQLDFNHNNSDLAGRRADHR